MDRPPHEDLITLTNYVGAFWLLVFAAVWLAVKVGERRSKRRR